jgi:hypothetical protein
VRKLPFFGSLVHQFSGTPPFLPHTMYDYEIKMRQKFGEFYNMGFPVFGRGVFGETISITNPNEMLKVIRAEGKYPSGVVNFAWTFIQSFRDDNSAMMKGQDNGLLGQGERWKQQRTFLQTGMLDPRSARGFLPGIITAAELASKGAPAAGQQHQLNYYLNLCAFDMFSSFMFGELTNCSASAFSSDNEADNNNNNNHKNQEENMKFCRAAIDAMEQSGKLGRTPTEGIAHKIFGYKTESYKEFYESWTIVREIGMKKLHHFVDRYDAGTLSELERNSYMANAVERLEQENGNGKEEQISKEEMLEVCMFALFVGVDTTRYVNFAQKSVLYT